MRGADGTKVCVHAYLCGVHGAGATTGVHARFCGVSPGEESCSRKLPACSNAASPKTITFKLSATLTTGVAMCACALPPHLGSLLLLCAGA